MCFEFVWDKKRDKIKRTTAVHNVVVGFFLACEDFGRMFDNSSPACAFFFLFSFKVEISSRTLIPLFRPESVHSGSAS